MQYVALKSFMYNGVLYKPNDDFKETPIAFKLEALLRKHLIALVDNSSPKPCKASLCVESPEEGSVSKDVPPPVEPELVEQRIEPVVEDVAPTNSGDTKEDDSQATVTSRRRRL